MADVANHRTRWCFTVPRIMSQCSIDSIKVFVGEVCTCLGVCVTCFALGNSWPVGALGLRLHESPPAFSLHRARQGVQRLGDRCQDFQLQSLYKGMIANTSL